MSRIEQALEKAARQNKRSSVEISQPEPAPVDRTLSEPDNSDPVAQISHKVDNPMFAALREKNDLIAEEYKKLRSLIIKLTKGDSFKNTLMVTSTVSGEGKSLTALNLAFALAKEYDHSVLLVDTDLRRPSIHKYLGIDPEVGLIQCVKEKLPLNKALLMTGVGNMAILPAGGTLDDPVEFLSSNRMKEFINKLKTEYPDRYIIFDTPPMQPFADAYVLKDSIDSILFVVRERAVRLHLVKKVLSELKNSSLLGVVYNDKHASSENSSYYYY